MDDIDDLTQLIPLTDDAVLSSLRTRYDKGVFYTRAGIALIAINPNRFFPHLYSTPVIDQYSEPNKSDCPHIFEVGSTVLRLMRQRHVNPVNQSIIVSGESGAGKTWTARCLMSYFAATTSKLSTRRESLAVISAIEQKVLDSSPILEAFGNASTVRNDNSSRFGKYVQLQLNGRGKIVGAQIQTYLLEKIRVARQCKNERNYHIFYQLMRGYPNVESLGLESPSMMNIHTRDDDACLFEETSSALTRMGLGDLLKEQVFGLLAAILHLNSIVFEVMKQSDHFQRAVISPNSQRALNCAARLLCVNVETLHTCLLSSELSTGHGEVITRPCSPTDAEWRRDCLTKLLYEKLFDWIVQFINNQMSAKKTKWQNFIGLLDVYGFESLDSNSLEQLCINYANERLQQLYVSSFLRARQEEYSDEGVPWDPVQFADNRPCVDLIAGRISIFSLLEEECRLNRRHLPDGMYSRLLSSLSEHSCFVVPKSGGSAKSHKTSFIIEHYAGNVVYNVDDFLGKNQDYIPPEMIAFLQLSTSTLVRQFFPESKRLSKASSPRQGPSSRRKKTIRTVVTRFKNSLEQLVAVLKLTTVHYIRCIKPNNENEPGLFVEEKVLSQLKACGVMETVEISSLGYSSQMTYAAFVSHYMTLLPASMRKSLQSDVTEMTAPLSPEPQSSKGKRRSGVVLQSLHNSTKVNFKRRGSVLQQQKARSRRQLVTTRLKDATKSLLETQISAAKDSHYFGYTKVFMRDQLVETLETALERRRSDSASCLQLRWKFLRHRQEKEKRRATIIIQKTLRGLIARRRFQKILASTKLIQRRWKNCLRRRTTTSVTDTWDGAETSPSQSKIQRQIYLNFCLEKRIASLRSIPKMPIVFTCRPTPLPFATCEPTTMKTPQGLEILVA
ncbi:unconventional myosin-XIX-like [Oscarella lobularis]|uniref:unconventional myosin-XIX-like n=1 Tax=Oscarella lobularis TaxID=121494 RepID=UPI003313FC7D